MVNCNVIRWAEMIKTFNDKSALVTVDFTIQFSDLLQKSTFFSIKQNGLLMTLQSKYE